MIVTCDDCELDFDDVYRRRYCPHEWFGPRTMVATNTGHWKKTTKFVWPVQLKSYGG